MSVTRISRSCYASLALVALASIAIARADDAPALERVRAALAQAKHDLDEDRARAETARLEASSAIARAQARRDAALAKLDAARQAQRQLQTCEIALRSEIERATGEVAALENDLGPARELERRLAAELAQRPSAGSPDERADRARRAAALVKLAEAPGADLGAVASECLALLGGDLARASRVAVSEGDVVVEGRGRVRGRVLALGPWAWLAGDDHTEAVKRARDGAFIARDGEEIAGALAAVERGERTVELPIDATGDALVSSPSFLSRSAELLRQGGLAILPLALLSFITIIVLVERLIARARIVREARALVRAFASALAVRDVEAARARARSGGALGRALARAIAPGASKADIDQAPISVRVTLLEELRARLWLLGTVGASAPFVGLFGTVVGIVRAFEDIAQSGAAGFNVVAGGIAEALVATAAGIVVAVLAVVAYNALQAWAAATAARIAASVEEALARTPAEASHGV